MKQLFELEGEDGNSLPVCLASGILWVSLVCFFHLIFNGLLSLRLMNAEVIRVFVDNFWSFPLVLIFNIWFFNRVEDTYEDFDNFLL